MSWKETNVMEQRTSFVQDFIKQDRPFRELCAEYGISEKTGYKWKQRFLQSGITGLADLSRKPRNSPAELGEDPVIRLISIRNAHPTWGAKKIAVLYTRAYRNETTPSLSSINRVLGKADLVRKRRFRRAVPDANRLRRHILAEAPNDVWTVDFKGWWMSGGEKCLPLTIRDLKSKYLLAVTLVVTTSTEAVRSVFLRLFRKYGLPKVIRSDNGTPFANAHAILQLSTLSCWWITLGILPDRIDPGMPTQNGSHERMHADLASEVQAQKIPGGIVATQHAIDLWREEYNTVRPHEALGMLTPAEIYYPSSRAYEGDPDVIEYPPGFLPRKVRANGLISIDGIVISISYALRGLTIGLQPQKERGYLAWLADFPLGFLDVQSACFQPLTELE